MAVVAFKHFPITQLKWWFFKMKIPVNAPYKYKRIYFIAI